MMQASMPGLPGIKQAMKFCCVSFGVHSLERLPLLEREPAVFTLWYAMGISR